MSMRRCALLLRVHTTTIKRKLDYLAKKARLDHREFLRSIAGTVTHLQFDDLITIEHTKLKPLSVSVMIDAKTRYILGAEVSQIPASGKIAKISRKKYGYRKNFHSEGLKRLFESIQELNCENSEFASDRHPYYEPIMKKYFPEADYRQFKGEKSSVAGYGELKKKRNDPLFKINQTLAMLRDNINRLRRRTWCTTKKPEEFKKHLDLYIHFHNTVLIQKKI